MSQHDYNLADDTGANFRADLNNALSAIATNNSGSSAPTTTFAFQWWLDTSGSPALLKLRNAANAAWWTIGTVEADGFGKLSLSGGTMTGQLLSVVGSSSAPGIGFAGDTNTGIYWVSADSFAVVVGGNVVMTFDSATYTQHNGTAAVKMPIGTTAQRPTGTNGLIRYNSDLNQFEGYSTGLWKPVGSGGGGAGFVWRDLGGTAPVSGPEENGELPWYFGAGLAQELYAAVKVPQSYSAGTQIKIYVSAYSPSSSNTILMQAQSTLIRKDTDAFDSTTNQRTSTNSALTNTVAKMIREFVLDVTDASGQINSVAVSAGDIIKVRLYRGTDSDTADLRMLPNATDVKFS